MATTRLIPLHVNKRRTATACMKARLDYAENLDKTNNGELVSSYECDPHLAWQEFMLDRNKYLSRNGSERRGDILAYQIRQSFKPGEIKAEEANAVGYELAKRFTKGKHAFVVATHNDRAHLHNHIIFNAVDLQGKKKFRNFFMSSYALRKLSDIVCFEHGLSIVDEKTCYEWQNQSEYNKGESKSKRSFSLMKNFEQIVQEKKGKGYEIWARHFNNTQAAEVLIFLQENHIDSIEKLEELAERSTEQFHALSKKIKKCEIRLKEIAEVKKAITDYSKTRSTYEEYRKAGYSKVFYEKHREEVEIHKAAKSVFDSLPGDKLPKMKDLTKEYKEVLAIKKGAYSEYRGIKKDMKLYTTAKKNVDMIMGRESVPERNAQPSRDA